MILARPILAARFRLRWRTLVVIAVLAGLGLGASGGAIAIARRTDSAYRRVADAQQAVHLEWGYNATPQEFFEELQANPEPALGTVRQWVGYAEVFDPLGLAPDLLAPWQSDAQLEEPFVIEGVAAHEANELNLNEFAATHSNVGVGASVQLGLMTSDFTQVIAHDFEVAGIVEFAAEFGMADDTLQSPAILLSRAFAEAHPEHIIWYSAGSVLDDGPPTRAEASALTQRHGWTLENLSVDKEAKVRAALRPAVTSLYLLGALGLVATVAVLSFALSRELELWSGDRVVLRALGAGRRQRRALDGLHVVVVVAAVFVLALAASFGLSRLGPVGDLRRFDRDIGFRLDWLATASIVVGALAAGFAAFALANREPSGPRVVASHDVAASLLAGTATSSRRTVAMTMLLALLAVAAAAAAIPYVTSLSTLIDEPERYGQPWDVMARNRWGDQSPDAIAAVVADPAVVAASTIASGSLVINDSLSAAGAGYDVVKGADLLTIVDGRRPRSESEAVVGPATRQQLGLELGATVKLERAIENQLLSACCGEAVEVTLVGDALFPALAVPGGALPRLDQGLMVSPATWARLVGVEDHPEVTLLSTIGGDAGTRLADTYSQIEDLGQTNPRTEWFIGAQPAEIRTVESARNIMIGGLVGLTVVIAGVLGLALRTILTSQRRDLAVLRALGASRRQVRRIAWRQGVMLLVPLTVLGVPMGIALGRLLYSRLATSIGVISEPQTPWWAIMAFLTAMAALSAMTIAASGRAAGAVAPALSLREP